MTAQDVWWAAGLLAMIWALLLLFIAIIPDNWPFDDEEDE